jgi:hypothetical protein
MVPGSPRPEQAGVAPVLDEGDHLAVPRRAQDDGLTPLAQVVADDRVLLVHREEDDLAAGDPRHLDRVGVVGVEDAGAIGKDRLRHDLFHPRQLGDGVDPLQTEMVG